MLWVYGAREFLLFRKTKFLGFYNQNHVICRVNFFYLLLRGLAGVSKKNSLGKSHGFDCKIQGTLFFEIARILEHHRPKAFLLENVKNLKSHDKGQTFETILDVLENKLGYKVQHRIINAKSFVPQNRQRINSLSILRDKRFCINYPMLNFITKFIF